MPRGDPGSASKRKKRGSGTSRTTLNEKLSNDELLQQLKSIADELSEAEQTSASQYDATANFLTRPFVLKHKDKGVRLYAACCLVDILRIYAPEPPFNSDRMWDVFSLIISQLRGLEHGTKGLNYKKHFYILESLALVRTFTVCMDMDFQDLILQLFKLFFSIVNENHPVKVLNFMVDVMSPVFEEGESIPQELLDTVLIHIIEPQKSRNSGAYRVACSLIERTSSSMEPYIQMFFNSVLTLGKTSESDLAERVYDLILELNRIAAPVLLSVLPQLEFKLKSPDLDDRLAVTKLLAQMFADQESELAAQNKSLWNSYLGRYHDINVDVRLECVKKAKYFLVSHPDLTDDISDKLSGRARDPDEKVRQEMVTATCEAASERIESVSDKLFEDVCERMRDKKWHVRREAMMCLGKLFKKFTTGSTANAEAAKRLSWVPSKLLNWYYQHSVEDRLCVERLLSGCLVPVTLPTEDRTKRLLSLYTKLDDHAISALAAVLKCQANVRADLLALVELVEKEKTNENDKMILSHIIALARALPDPFKSQENLKKLPEMLKESKMRELMKTCVNPNAGCPAVFKAVTDLVVKLGARNPILDTMKALLDRAAPVLIDAACVKILLKRVKDIVEGIDDEEDEFDNLDDSANSVNSRGPKGLDLLLALSNVFPSHFQNEECFELILVFLKHHDTAIVDKALRILSNTAEKMESCAASIVSYYQPVLSKLAVKGTPQHSKYALRSLAKIFKDPLTVFDRVFTNVVESLEYDHPLLLTYLTTLGEIAIMAPSLFETKQKFIIRDFVVKELLVKDRGTQEEAENEGEVEWCADCDVTRETQAKVKAIKVMVKWLQGLQSNHKNSGLPVVRLLDTMLAHAGDLQNNNCVCPHDASRLRLAASCGLLKIAQEIEYEEVVSLEHYHQLALAIQDPCIEVRSKFIKKLHKALDSLKLPLDYLAIFCLAATESDKDKKTQVKQMIVRNVTIRKEYLKQHSVAQACSHSILPEYALPCVIHLLAHHPDFNPKDHESLVEFKEYLWFFMEPIVASKTDNTGLLKKIIENVKQTKDAQCPDDDDANMALYTLCDLAYGLILNKASGLVANEYPLNPILPKKMFVPGKMATPNTKSYLPQNFMFFPGKQKKATPAETNKASAKPSTSGSKGKKAASTANKKATSKKQTKSTRGKTFKDMANDVEPDINDNSESATDATEESGLGSPPPKTTPKKRGRPPASPAKKPAAAKKQKIDTPSKEESESEDESSSQESSPRKGTASRGRGRLPRSPAKKPATAKKPKMDSPSKEEEDELESEDEFSSQESSPRKGIASRGRGRLPRSPAKKLATAKKQKIDSPSKEEEDESESKDESSSQESSPRKGTASRERGRLPRSPAKKPAAAKETKKGAGSKSPARKISVSKATVVASPRRGSRRLDIPEEETAKSPAKSQGKRVRAAATSTPASPSKRTRTVTESPSASPAKRGGRQAKGVAPASPVRASRAAKSPSASPAKGSAESPARRERAAKKVAQPVVEESPRKGRGRGAAQRESPRRKGVGASPAKLSRSPFRVDSPIHKGNKSPMAGRAVRKLQSDLDALPEDDAMESGTDSPLMSARNFRKQVNEVQLNGLKSPRKRNTSPRKGETQGSPSKKRKPDAVSLKQSKKAKPDNKATSRASPKKRSAASPKKVPSPSPKKGTRGRPRRGATGSPIKVATGSPKKRTVASPKKGVAASPKKSSAVLNVRRRNTRKR